LFLGGTIGEVLKNINVESKGLNSPCHHESGLRPLIYNFRSREDTTICIGGSERARVCIKVCNVDFLPIGLVRKKRSRSSAVFLQES
jgi:hypothetical protein